ncbi:putative cysteine dioxygenase Cdo1 [Piedraia hortae CBS 480.64]|uniref:Cysteine dioxygenase n=1 Tax=Piedraia hortae CBS 480.64 TaxID=1314780 RepID=A0A6A7BZD2_9PEZI|nr:putative cysteine dioxygenase Cdo1 [Piedraia hortae CBS 480.64]
MDKDTMTFQSLISDLNTLLGPSNGIDKVSISSLKSLMRSYNSQRSEWTPYAFADYSRAYTRNLVSHGNGAANILVLVWSPGRQSYIHDHANSHCVMKVLHGRLTETVYSWPCERGEQNSPIQASPIQASPIDTCETEHKCSSSETEHKCSSSETGTLRVKRAKTYGEDEVTYMSDRLGLHRIRNEDPDDVAVSLHVYTPPNAARHGCHIFDEETGRKSHVLQCSFYSELGVKVEG